MSTCKCPTATETTAENMCLECGCYRKPPPVLHRAIPRHDLKTLIDRAGGLYVETTIGPFVRVEKQALFDALAKNPFGKLPLYEERRDGLYISRLPKRAS